MLSLCYVHLKKTIKLSFIDAQVLKYITIVPKKKGYMALIL